MYNRGVKKLRSVLYNIFIILGTTLFFSRLLSRIFGLKEQLSGNVELIIGYELAILLSVSLGWYWYNRRHTNAKPGKQENGTASYPEELITTINELRRRMRKEAVILRSSPTQQMPEGYVSCLGRVTWQLPGEEWPTDAQGKRLEPLATIFVPDMTGVPKALSKMALITIFAPEGAWAELPEEKPTLGCVIRTYPTLEDLEPCNYVSSVWNTCQLTPEAVANDMSFSRCSGGGDEIWDKIVELEEKYDIEYEEKICDAAHHTNEMRKFPAGYFSNPSLHATFETHKIGGYPTFLQDGEVPENYTFVLQLNYDEEAGLDIADAGCYYFFYNAEKNDWLVTSDSY